MGKATCNNFVTKRYISSDKARNLVSSYRDVGGEKILHPNIRNVRYIVNKDIRWASMRGLTGCRTCIKDNSLSFNELQLLQKNLENDGFDVKTTEYLHVYKIDVVWQFPIIKPVILGTAIAGIVCFGVIIIIAPFGSSYDFY